MSYPKNKNEWWELVEKEWTNLLNMAYDQFQMDYPAFDSPGNANTPQTGRTVLKEMEYLKKTKNSKLAIYFHNIWGLSSDNYAYSKPGWSSLCDLCSESFVLEED